MKKKIKQFNLFVPSWWDSIDPERRQEYKNGVGADWMPAKLRGFLDKYSGFREPADVHDVEVGHNTWLFGLGKISYTIYSHRLDEADLRFRRNCRIVVKSDDFFLRLYRHAIIIRFYFAVRAYSKILKGRAHVISRRK